MIILLQQTPSITVPPDTPAWMVIFMLMSPAIIYMLKRWSDSKLLEAQQITAEAKEALLALKRDVATVPNAALAKSMQKFLVIDDDENDLELTRLWFRQLGMVSNVVAADSVRYGLDYLREHPETLFVLVDIKMVANGINFLKQIKDDPTTRPIPVILVSGSDIAETVEFYRMGASGYVRKPLKDNVFELLTILNREGFSIVMAKE